MERCLAGTVGSKDRPRKNFSIRLHVPLFQPEIVRRRVTGDDLIQALCLLCTKAGRDRKQLEKVGVTLRDYATDRPGDTLP